ncbi:Type II secretion system (T2SS), protein F [Propionibacterium ruminifibrarum]|uniref:Type II secretion system (T2SS), protein F n=1 Tax=Propionibacterium ruminifibrarum TaxID=1962131 RepID=A0A375I1G6_9ACTN|nr:type II secretion system F family protein [Propionibacterium ruminifibrarum]SPF67946.1 Type II secretion system (T2SS), protein F [Propionibacterium ruminifibrarum]
MIAPAVAAGCCALACGLLLVPDGGVMRVATAGTSPGMVPDRGEQGVVIPARVRGAGAVSLAALLLVLLPGPPAVTWPLSTAAGVAAWFLIAHLEPGRVRARREQLILQQPEVLELMASSLQAGAALRTATSEVAAVAPEPSATLLRDVESHLRVGFSEAAAWDSLRSHPVWGPASRDLARGARTGEAIAETLDMHAELARRTRRNHVAERARTVGVRSVGPMMCCFLPAFILSGVVPIVAGVLANIHF